MLEKLAEFAETGAHAGDAGHVPSPLLPPPVLGFDESRRK